MVRVALSPIVVSAGSHVLSSATFAMCVLFDFRCLGWCRLLVRSGHRDWRFGALSPFVVRELWCVPYSFIWRLGGLRYRCAVRTVVRALVLLHFFILFAGHLQEWKLVSGLLGSWIRPLAASISATFRVAPYGCPLFVAGPFHFVSVTLFGWLCGVRC